MMISECGTFGCSARNCAKGFEQHRDVAALRQLARQTEKTAPAEGRSVPASRAAIRPRGFLRRAQLGIDAQIDDLGLGRVDSEMVHDVVFRGLGIGQHPARLAGAVLEERRRAQPVEDREVGRARLVDAKIRDHAAPGQHPGQSIGTENQVDARMRGGSAKFSHSSGDMRLLTMRTSTGDWIVPAGRFGSPGV